MFSDHNSAKFAQINTFLEIPNVLGYSSIIPSVTDSFDNVLKLPGISKSQETLQLVYNMTSGQRFNALHHDSRGVFMGVDNCANNW